MVNLTKLETKVIHQARLLLPYCDGNYRHVSVLAHGKRIVAVGTNSYTKTHPLAKKFNHRGSYQHSELAAIVNFTNRGYDDNLKLRNCKLYNVRIRPTGEFGLAAPCSSCRKLIMAFNIAEVFYTNNYGEFDEMSGM